MGAYYWFRVLMMIGSLVAVIWTIRTINERGIGRAGSFFVKTENPGEVDVQLCPTRVKAVRQAGNVSVVERAMEWFREDSDKPRKLNPVAVEKWFGENCKVKGKISTPSTLAGFQPAATFEYVSGAPEILLANPAGVFLWQGLMFESEELSRALQGLPALPPATIPGQ